MLRNDARVSCRVMKLSPAVRRSFPRRWESKSPSGRPHKPYLRRGGPPSAPLLLMGQCAGAGADEHARQEAGFPHARGNWGCLRSSGARKPDLSGIRHWKTMPSLWVSELSQQVFCSVSGSTFRPRCLRLVESKGAGDPTMSSMVDEESKLTLRETASEMVE